MLDFENCDGTTCFSPNTHPNQATVLGITGHNEWLASIPGNVIGGAGFGELQMEITTTDAGFYPIVVELLRIG